MADSDNDKTVIVENGERRSNTGLIIGIIVVVLAIILFFAFGGTRLFTGGTSTTNNSPSVNVTTPTSGTGGQ